MQQVFIEGGVIRKLWSIETNAYPTICSGSMMKAAVVVSVARSPTIWFAPMPQRRAAAM